MQTKIIEATNGFNWGKFLLGRLDHEWQLRSSIEPDRLLLPQLGWSQDARLLWVLDLQTGEGAYFRIGGSARSDLQKHRIWVCPLFEPFLGWLYAQDVTDLDRLPALVELPNADSALYGYRRPGASDEPNTQGEP